MRKPNEIIIRNQIVDKIIDENQYGEKIYHYTSVASLVGILSKKELWLGNTANMNDKTEITHFVNQLYMAVSQDIYPEKIGDCDTFFDKVHSRLKTEYPFAICFSKLNDNAAQWERYADGAHGVCVVFNVSAFLNLIYYSGAIFTKVFYQYNIEDHDHYKILKDYFNTGILKKLSDEKGEIDNLLACAYRYKHESFCTESELRLSTLWDNKIAASDFSFEMINGKVKKVLKLSLQELCAEENIDFESLIEGIVIAPRSEQNEQELSEYVESLGYKGLCNKITRSQCPLR